MKLKLKLEITLEHMDCHTLSWIEELKDKAREQGGVDSCILSGVPENIDLGG